MLEKKVFHHSKQVCQTAKAPCSALQYVNLWRSFPIAVVYLGTSDISFDLLCATITQEINHLRAGSSLAARCCVQSKISQGIKSKAQSDNLHGAAPAQLSLTRDSNYHFQQLLRMGIRKSRHKILPALSLLYKEALSAPTTKGYVREERLQDLLLPLGFSPVLFTSGWADQVLLALHTGAAETALPAPA